MKKENPFLISGYISPDYFCDRENETEIVTDAIVNRRHLTIFSPRRLGKTGLIKHVFFLGNQKRHFSSVYVDILATGSLKEFTECFGRAVLTSQAKNQSAIKKILKNLTSLRPKISLDAVTGEPSVSFTISNAREAEESLETIFRFIREQKNHIAIAIDEFQQVADYPEKNIEAILRTQIQETSNVSLIFSGSRKHMLSGIFTAPDRPFYNSTQMMEIGKIEINNYKSFIYERFRRNSIHIDIPAIEMILEVTGLHTFYVQYLSNRLFSMSVKIDKERVKDMLMTIINENEPVYAGYINLLTPLQFKILRAISINEGVRNPTSGEFISAYDLGAASSVSQAVKSLTDKEFITLSDNKYILNDLFFYQWMRYKGNIL